jgi:hypothetical protein
VRLHDDDEKAINTEVAAHNFGVLSKHRYRSEGRPFRRVGSERQKLAENRESLRRLRQGRAAPGDDELDVVVLKLTQKMRKLEPVVREKLSALIAILCRKSD